jgi:EmrB/QacA subfamily drug resistance transporter
VTSTQRWSMVAAILGSAIVFLDGTIVNVGLAKIGDSLPSSILGRLEGLTYVTSGYYATLAALLALSGALADYYGRRRIFIVGLAGFGATSVLCGLAPTLEILVVARLLQGAAGALLVPGSIAIITALFEGPARARAFGIWAAATSATSPIGTLVGGTLIDTVGWRAAFLINVPIIAVALYATVRHMPETRAEQASASFDWLGSLVAILAVGGLAFGVIRGQDQQWRDPTAFFAIGVGLVALIAFPVLMARRPHPLVPLSLFRNRRFTVINLSTLLIYAALYVNFTFQSLALQAGLGYTALAAGAVQIPVGILLTLLSTRVGTLAGRYGARRFLTVGPVLMALGLLWYVRLPATSTSWVASITDPATLVPPLATLVDVLPSVVLFGTGIALVVAPLTATLMGSVPVRLAATASAVNNAISRVGQPILAAVIFVVVSGAFYVALGGVADVDPNDPALRSAIQPLTLPPAGTDPALAEAARIASIDAFHLASLASAILLLAGAATNWFGLRGQATAAERSEAPADAAAAPPDAASA